MRLQRRLYGIYFVCFLTFMTPCRCKLVSFFVKFLNRPYIYLFKAVNLIWRGNRHILRVLGRLHSIKFCGSLYICCFWNLSPKCSEIYSVKHKEWQFRVNCPKCFHNYQRYEFIPKIEIYTKSLRTKKRLYIKYSMQLIVFFCQIIYLTIIASFSFFVINPVSSLGFNMFYISWNIVVPPYIVQILDTSKRTIISPLGIERSNCEVHKDLSQNK